MKEITCDLLRERYTALRKQAEECGRLIVTHGILNETFINAFRSFEEKKQGLKKVIKERERRFSFLQDLYFKKRRSKEIREIFNRFDTERKAIAYIFRCREDQVSGRSYGFRESASGKDTVYYNGDFTYYDTTLSEGFKLPENIHGGLELPNLTALPRKFRFPKRMNGGVNFYSLTALREGISFPSHINGNLRLDSLATVSGRIVFPKRINGSLYLPETLKGNPLLIISKKNDVVWV